MLAYEVDGGINKATIYVWDGTVSGGADSPWVVAGSTGFWVAIGGAYNVAGANYGCVNGSGLSDVITLAAQDTWYQVASFNNNSAHRGAVTPDHTNDHLTVDDDGDYQVSIFVSLFSALVNDYEFSVFKNNGAVRITPITIPITTLTGSKTMSGSALCFADINAGDTIELWVQRTNGAAVSKTITIKGVILNIRALDR